MSLTNGQVASRFKERRAGKGINMSTDGNILYSYITPIAQYVNMDGGSIAVLNGDRYSVTSAGHLNALGWSFINNSPTVSFSALLAAGVAEAYYGYTRRTTLKEGVTVVAFEEAAYEEANDTEPEFDTIFANMPIGATKREEGAIWRTVIKYHCKYGYDEVACPGHCWSCPDRHTLHVKERIPAKRSYHRAGACVLRYGNYDYLCGFDEGSYFVSKLPLQVKSVEGAFMVLMPKAVIGKDFLRQGEWFFVKAEQEVLDALAEQGQRDVMAEYNELTGSAKFPFLPGMERVKSYLMYVARKKVGGMGKRYTITGFKRIANTRALPRRPGSNAHVVTHLYDTGVLLLAAGTVRHPEHRMLKLEPKTVYEVYRNNSLGDWSAQGRVD